MKADVEILLSAYNGERYLREQLDSLLALDGIEKIKISARDDGSSDGTCDILREYAEKHAVNITLGEHIGLNASMMALLENADCRFFAFCDQDDVWGPGKITAAVAALSAGPETMPRLWGCMEELTGADLKKISMMPVPRYLGDFYNAIVQNKLAGHTQVFNRALRDLLLQAPPGAMYLYDWFNYILASSFGEVIFERQCHGQYRQHGDNAVGYELNPFLQIPRRLKRLRTGVFKQISKQMLCFNEHFGAKLAAPYKTELARFLNSRKHFFTRFLYICKTKIKRDTRFESLQFRVLYLLGVYGR